ncbi:MAG: hypothetical protein M1488_02535 [Gammaproteobacteria bacterium]|nr:hypothetical protein [Gammaproteobacteria bacterium]
MPTRVAYCHRLSASVPGLCAAAKLPDQRLLYPRSSPRAYWKESTPWQQRAKPPAPPGAIRSGPPPKKTSSAPPPARLWFTVGKGIVTEVFYPRIDIP